MHVLQTNLMRGKIGLFSLDMLMDMATVAGLEPHITIKKPKSKGTRKRVAGEWVPA